MFDIARVLRTLCEKTPGRATASLVMEEGADGSLSETILLVTNIRGHRFYSKAHAPLNIDEAVLPDYYDLFVEIMIDSIEDEIRDKLPTEHGMDQR